MTSREGADGIRALKGLWLARESPFPADMGDRIYSAYLAKALAEAGADVTFVGLRSEIHDTAPKDWPLRWNLVEGRRKTAVRAFFSPLPLVAASYATAGYRKQVRLMMDGRWDFVVIDQLALGWALQIIASVAPRLNRPVLAYVAHNHEASLWQSFYREFEGTLLKRMVLWQNYVKTRALERKVISRVDLVTAITEEDADKFSGDFPGIRSVVLKPGYSGAVSPRDRITAETPRRVVLVGSFRWSAKQENLRQFVRIADPIFARHGIEFHVVGPIPDAFAKELEGAASATRFMGFVDQLEPVLASARIAVVPEAIGGGFKLKFLDYIFGRVPVATLARATAGLPAEIGEAMIRSDTLDQLAVDIADAIDDIAALNAMQERALHQASAMFRWSDRGEELLKAIRECKGV